MINTSPPKSSLMKLLGSGQFGKVHQGEWTAPGTGAKVKVAVKTLKKGSGEQDKVKLLQEAAIMGQFSHPNVVKLYGVITEGEPVSTPFSLIIFLSRHVILVSQIMLILELLPKGDLRKVLHGVHSK